MHRNDPLNLSIFIDDPKNIHKINIPPKNSFFPEKSKHIEIQNFEPQKVDQAYVYEGLDGGGGLVFTIH